jgi:hypothetical protein
MSDLLKRIVQRTLAPSAVIQPMPVSRFEPVGILSGTLQTTEDTRTNTYQTQLHTQNTISGEVPSEIPRSRAVTKEEYFAPSPASSTEKAGPLNQVSPQKETRQSVARDIFSEHSDQKTDNPKQFQPPISDVRPLEVHASPSPVSWKEFVPEKGPAPALFLKERTRGPKVDSSPEQYGPTAGPVAQNASGSRAPEITISIGHIELRAAHAPQAPRKPAFRPQLSLDEFLNKKPGARP